MKSVVSVTGWNMEREQFINIEPDACRTVIKLSLPISERLTTTTESSCELRTTHRKTGTAHYERAEEALAVLQKEFE
jgi:hypothetical protein